MEIARRRPTTQLDQASFIFSGDTSQQTTKLKRDNNLQRTCVESSAEVFSTTCLESSTRPGDNLWTGCDQDTIFGERRSLKCNVRLSMKRLD